MKLIFLDVDGVLVNRSSLMKASGFRAKADPECVAALNRIIEATGAEIVISSTWRIGGLEWMRTQLAEWGVVGAVRGMTGQFSQTRGREIGDYLIGDPSAGQFVILDDDSDMGIFSRYLIQTQFESGLTMEHARQAIASLADLERQHSGGWILTGEGDWEER